MFQTSEIANSRYKAMRSYTKIFNIMMYSLKASYTHKTTTDKAHNHLRPVFHGSNQMTHHSDNFIGITKFRLSGYKMAFHGLNNLKRVTQINNININAEINNIV